MPIRHCNYTKFYCKNQMHAVVELLHNDYGKGGEQTMKIKIRKAEGKSQIFLDDKPIPNCTGYEIISKGGDGFVTVQLTILADTLDMVSEAQELRQSNKI